MNEGDIFKQTKNAYLCLIHPVQRDNIYGQEIAPVVALASSAPDEFVRALIVGKSWRERLLGLCMGASKEPAIFIEAILQSLRDPRGIAIVPACAPMMPQGAVPTTARFLMTISRFIIGFLPLSISFLKKQNGGHRPPLQQIVLDVKFYAVGIFNFSPTTMRSVPRSLTDLRALMVTLWLLAMCERVSPDLTK